MEMTSVRWRPSSRSGALGDLVWVELPQAEFDELRVLYFDRGREAFVEIRNRMDLWALFPGATLNEYETRARVLAPVPIEKRVEDEAHASLFDVQAGIVAREEAIERVSHAAPEDWVAAGISALREIALSKPELTTDDIWELLDQRGVEPPPERRAMAAVVRHGQSKGWLSQTDRFIQSKIPWAHRRNTQVWESCLLPQALPF